MLYEGLPNPVLCSKIRYYKDRYFTKRLLERAEVKPLTLQAAGPTQAHRGVSSATSS
ncbi:hypothetical protein D3C73_1529080 [compost metagenome]